VANEVKLREEQDKGEEEAIDKLDKLTL